MSDYDPCPDCGHQWHGLSCSDKVVTRREWGGTKTEPCKCKTSFKE